jgi:hypothetical protein
MFAFQGLDRPSGTLLIRRAISSSTYTSVGRRSAVGTPTCYKLDVPGIETRWGWDFPHASRPALGLTQPPIKCLPRLSREEEKLKKEHSYTSIFPSRPSWSVLGWTLPYLCQHSSMISASLFTVLCEISAYPPLNNSAFGTAQWNIPRTHQHMMLMKTDCIINQTIKTNLFLGGLPLPLPCFQWRNCPAPTSMHVILFLLL